ncbi:hypothetical protein ACHAWF_017588, partial [Thalassiosira exigua]
PAPISEHSCGVQKVREVAAQAQARGSVVNAGSALGANANAERRPRVWGDARAILRLRTFATRSIALTLKKRKLVQPLMLTNALLAFSLLQFDGNGGHQSNCAYPSSSSVVIADASNDVGDISSQYSSWNLPNGRVQFDRPLRFPGIAMEDGGRVDMSNDSKSALSLWNPVFLGSGGSGAVFSFSTNQNNNDQNQNGGEDNVAIKVSWVRSRQSVENECSILQTLEDNHVPHVEMCLGQNPYPFESGRVMIALTPVVAPTAFNGGITSRIDEVAPGSAREYAVRELVETMIGMLRAGIYTVDVQPLITRRDGEVLFVDFTEAKQISSTLTI